MSDPVGADAAVLEAKKRGFYVSDVWFDTDDTWIARLRRLGERPFMHSQSRTIYARRGRGVTIEAAIRNAMLDQFEDVLG